MALPKINNAPKFEMTIPSLNKKVRYRPFLVKEEKTLLIALETGDPQSSLNAVFDTINSCCEEDFKPDDLTAYDVEYMFLQLRAKSVGETSKLKTECTKCGASNEVGIDLTKVEVNGTSEQKDTKIKINDEITVRMKWPSYGQLMRSEVNLDNLTKIDSIFKLILTCIDAVLTEEEQFKMADVPESEAMEFLESLNTEQFNKIREYVEGIPQVKYNIHFNCSECGEVNDTTVTGLTNFF